MTIYNSTSTTGTRYPLNPTHNVHYALPIRKNNYSLNSSLPDPDNNSIKNMIDTLGVIYYVRAHGLGWMLGDSITLDNRLTLQNLSAIDGRGRPIDDMGNNLISKEFLEEILKHILLKVTMNMKYSSLI